MQSLFKIIMSHLNDQEFTSFSQSSFFDMVIKNICEFFEAPMGAFYLYNHEKDFFYRISAYQWSIDDNYPSHFQVDQGPVGLAACENKMMAFSLSSDNFLSNIFTEEKKIPASSMFLEYPVINHGYACGVVELVFYKDIEEDKIKNIFFILNFITVVLNFLEKKHHFMVPDNISYKLKSKLQELDSDIRVNEISSIKDSLYIVNGDLPVMHDQLTVNNYHEGEEQERNKKQEVTKYQTKFLANMSHELRTPLNSLLLLSQMLLDNEEENLKQDQIESLEVIYESGQDLLGLINDILDFSKLQSGKMEFCVEDIVITDMISHIKKIFDPLANNNNLKFNIILDNEVPDILRTDRQKLMQVLKNLIANALKFTDIGEVKLVVRICEKEVAGKQTQHIVFSVEDTGIGIPKEKLSLIFEAFSQADSSTTRKYGGTGLGLNITKMLSKFLGGFIEVNSQEGVGSNFELWLPNG